LGVECGFGWLNCKENVSDWHSHSSRRHSRTRKVYSLKESKVNGNTTNRNFIQKESSTGERERETMNMMA